MVEGGARQVGEEEMLEAFRFAHADIKKICALQEQIVAKPSASRSGEIVRRAIDPGLVAEVTAPLLRRDPIRPIRSGTRPEREAAVDAGDQGGPGRPGRDLSRQRSRHQDGLRHDREGGSPRPPSSTRAGAPTGAGMTDIRPITCEIGVLPRTHGSAVFTRGQTQALVVTTLGTGSDEQKIEELEGESWKSFLLHYNFPSYSRRRGAPHPRARPARDRPRQAGRARARAGVIPSEEHFPYTIRIVSDILESNGSSSMATVCGGSLALMDAGVPIKTPVAGIAMGLDQGRGQDRDPHRHPRRRGSPGRHGLQGRRHPQGHHRHPDGHQDQGARFRRPRAGRSSRPAQGRLHILGDDGQDDRPAARPSSRRTRRASPCSRSTRTRSATSSARAAR